MAGPFPERTVEAVSACTRTLAGSPDADATLDRTNAASLGGLRAFADRLALRQRFHNPVVHHRHRPSDPRAADLYAAVELARLDALGAAWLTGVAKNLLAHPGAEADGPRWLAFEVLSGRVAPPEKTAMAAAVRARLPPSLLRDLAALATDLRDPARVAPAIAAWAIAAAPHVPAAEATPVAENRFPLPTRLVTTQRRRNSSEGADAARGDRRDGQTRGETSEQGDGDYHASGPNTGPTEARGGGYRVYTTAHDRVVYAASLATREELAQLRLALDADLSAVRSVVARLAKRLLRVLMARQVREWRFDQEEGLLDASRLAPLIASRGATRPFKQETESRFPGTVVTLLIDHSGSMRGRPMQIAALTVEIFARVLERCGVKCEVLGFTTRDWNGGAPAREWAAAGYPENPGRVNALEHIIIKSADVPWRRARAALGLFLRDEMLKENIDGEALDWAHTRLLARAEPRRILVVISDGTPMDEATLAANDHEYLDRHLQTVVEAIEGRSRVQLAAIGIGHNVSFMYHNATTIQRVDELGPALTQKLMALFGSSDGPRA